MTDTITRGDVTLFPTAVLGWTLERAARAVVHPVLNTSEVEVTIRPPGPRTGVMTTLWWDEASAVAAYDALGTVGGPWVWAVPGTISAPLTAQVIDVTLEAAVDSGRRWLVRAGVVEVAP